MSPASTGAGNATGSHTDSDFPSALIVASGPLPPPDNVSADVVTAAETRPSLSRFNVAFKLSHAPPTCLRTGTRERFRVRVLSGFAVSVSVAVVAPGTATARPLEAARANACPTFSGPPVLADRAPALVIPA